MNQALNIAKNLLLEPSNLSFSYLEQLLSQMFVQEIDFADIYLQYANSESWVLEDGIIKNGAYSVNRGAGLRAISGEKTGFAYSDDLLLPALTHAAAAAKTIARSGKNQVVSALQTHQGRQLYKSINPLDTLSEVDKIALLRQVDAEAHRQDSRVSQVVVSLSGSYESILMMNTDGHLASDVRPLVRLNVSVIVEENGRREQGYFGGGARTGYDYFTSDLALNIPREAVREALVNLQAIDAPAGLMPVVLGPGWPGVLLHEAVGHGLEGDFNRKGSSAFTDRIGERVASSVCTVIDDGTIPGRRGSLNVDDEGTPTQRNVLIENGILKGYLQDKLNAKLMGTHSTGSGRREAYNCVPLPRMTNTFMLPGDYDPAEIISSVDRGLYAVNFAGGQVDITSGKFVFSASEAYLIEHGKVTHPVKSATLIGNGPDVLTKVSMVGNDLKFDNGIGTCGKDGQSIPVGVGQPTLKIDELTVGGTQ